MTKIQSLQLIALAAIWGASFLFMKVSAVEFGPLALIFVRASIGCLTLLPFLWFYKGFSTVRKQSKHIFIVGLTNTAIPFVALAYATLSLEAGFTSIINATAPIFTAIVAFIWLKEKFTGIKIFGLVVGFLGVVSLFAVKGSFSLDSNTIAILVGLFATLNYGFAACYTRKHLVGVSSLAIATGSQFFAVLALLPFLPFYWPEAEISHLAILSAVVLGSMCTALAYILYFKLLASLGPQKAITVTYLIPVFGIIWGVLFLNELVTMTILLSAVLILVGVSFTTGILKSRKR